MPRILVTAAFKFAVDGNHVIEVAPGEQDVSERCADVAVDQLKVASRLDGSAPGVKIIGPVVTTTAPRIAAVVPTVATTPPVVPPAVKKVVAKPKAVAKPKTSPAKPAASKVPA